MRGGNRAAVDLAARYKRGGVRRALRIITQVRHTNSDATSQYIFHNLQVFNTKILQMTYNDIKYYIITNNVIGSLYYGQ